MQKQPLNFFLRNRQQIEDCGQQLREAGLMEHGLSCKNFDLAYILPHIEDGNLLDMGSCGSFILYNAAKKGTKGEKIGIDLAYPDDYVLTWPPAHNIPVEGANCFKADLMNTPFEDGKFNYITCLSVIEHEVDFKKLAQECSRLLAPGGKLFVSFDFWPEKVDTKGHKLFGLNWNILDELDVVDLISEMAGQFLQLSNNSFIDWTVEEDVINPSYCSPADVSYTFGLFMFEKR